MSFSLGGDGNFLPPRPKNQTGGGGLGAKPTDRTPSGRVVQTSEPAFEEPGVRVRSGDQSVRLPIDTPKNVSQIANRKPKNEAEAAQSAVAKASGVVIPLANFRDLKSRGGVSQPATAGEAGGRLPGVAPRSAKARTPALADKSSEMLCRLVFIMQAAKYGHTLEHAGKTYSVEQVVSAAPNAAKMVSDALKSGKTTVAAVDACVRLYCQQNSCSLPSQTGTSNVIDDTTSPQVNANLPPAQPGIPGEGLVVVGGDLPLIKQSPPLKDEAAPAKKSNALWWILGLAAAAVLVKKLAAVKVIGAAVAGAPLVAELDGDEGDDEGGETDSDEHDDHDGPPEARDTDEE